jgi:hypothetical protein
VLVEVPVSELVPDRFPATELMPAQVVMLRVAGPSGETPDVIGRTPGDESSVAPRGIPVGATGRAGPMPSGDVIPSGDGLDGDVPIPTNCAEAELEPKSAAAAATISRRVICISLSSPYCGACRVRASSTPPELSESPFTPSSARK